MERESQCTFTTLRRKCTETVGKNRCAAAQWRSAEVCGSKNVIGQSATIKKTKNLLMRQPS